MSTKKTTWHHIRRSPFHSLTALIVVFYTFFLFTAFYFVSGGFNRILKFFETRPEVTIFLKDGLTKDIVQSVQNDLASYQDIKEIRFISKDDALKIYQEQNKDNPLLLEMVTADILPASFEISANNPQVLGVIEQDFSNRPNIVDEIVYQKDMAENLLIWTNRIRYFALAFIIIQSFESFIVIFAIIGMKITNRKQEIKTSRLLGASRYYVKKPFIFEGFLYGLIGSTLSYALVFCLVYFYQSDINNIFYPIEFVKLDYAYLLTVYTISTASAILLTLTASLISVKRYIKF